jgi:predicted RNA binding protein YcfA (HicA-like mRNA interferase family)
VYKNPREKRFLYGTQKRSHIVIRKNEPFYQLVVPDHKELDRGTLRAIIKQSGLSVEEFTNLI